MSEAMFNTDPPSGWVARSAGVSPAQSINPMVPGLLAEICIEIESKVPEVVKPEMIANASKVITFGCVDRCPVGTTEKAVDWKVHGANGKSIDQLREIRDDLLYRVRVLINDIKHNDRQDSNL